MRSAPRLGPWLRQLLPPCGRCAQSAARDLIHALLLQFTTDLCQLARQLPRSSPARSQRQFLSRWLAAERMEPEVLYAELTRTLRRVLGRGASVALLVDFTCLANTWIVLQVSVGFQGRALPLYRGVLPRTGSGQTELLFEAIDWLAKHLPGPRSRYVLVMDRGFPSHPLVQKLTEQGWRFVLRVSGKWKMTHADYTGYLRELPRPGAARLYRQALLGRRGKGRDEFSWANVVLFHGTGQAEAWLLLTSEARASAAVQLYRQRMRIEAEFRDLKGSWGLNHLGRWLSKERVARFLAWVALYEWWLAHLWLREQLAHWGHSLVVRGALSWITITRAWLHSLWRPAAHLALACL
jgi:DDE family transposase